MKNLRCSVSGGKWQGAIRAIYGIPRRELRTHNVPGLRPLSSWWKAILSSSPNVWNLEVKKSSVPGVLIAKMMKKLRSFLMSVEFFHAFFFYEFLKHGKVCNFLCVSVARRCNFHCKLYVISFCAGTALVHKPLWGLRRFRYFGQLT
jgi:hypothetical protein